MLRRSQPKGIDGLPKAGLSDEAVEEMTGLTLSDIIVLRAEAAAAAAYPLRRGEFTSTNTDAVELDRC